MKDDLKEIFWGCIRFLILLAIIASLAKLLIWLYAPTVLPQLGFEYVENDKLSCWRFADEQGRGPGHWNCTDKKVSK